MPTPQTHRHRSVTMIVAAFLLIVTTAFAVSIPQTARADDSPGSGGPCDIYAAANSPCVAAFSTTRALFRGYNGPLYQVQRASDDATRQIGLLQPGGYADAAAQDRFCTGTTCTVTVLYDQTARHNDLTIEGPGNAGPQNSGAAADALPITIAGHKAYGLYLPKKTGYRRSSTITTGTARGSEPESMYEVASGTNVNDDCCSDFGNVETNEQDTGEGHMDAVNISYMNGAGSTGTGPWVQADLENGVFEGGTSVNTANHGNASKFVTAMLKNNGTDTFALKGANSQHGALSTWYEGPLPSAKYTPMQLEGSIVLGTGGDNSNRGIGSFFEGVMTAGYSTNAADAAVQANIAAQRYQADTTGPGVGQPITTLNGLCLAPLGRDDAGAGTLVEPGACSTMSAGDHWVSSDFGQDAYTALGRCLAPTAAHRVALANCDGSVSQEWKPQPDGSIRNVGTGLCLTTIGDQQHPDLRLQTCRGSSMQQLITSVPIYHGGKCIDVAGGDNGVNHTAVQLWTCQTLPIPGAAAIDQKWTRNPQADTFTSLGRCMTPAGFGTADRTKIEIDDCGQSPTQLWRQEADGTIKNLASDRCLTDPGATPTNGTQLELQDCDPTSANQQFALN